VRIHGLFITRKGSEDAPELVEAWDEFSIDGWFDGWETAKAKALGAIGSDLSSSAVVEIDIPDDAVFRALNPRVVTVGRVQPAAS
jgi:hypothetical protein